MKNEQKENLTLVILNPTSQIKNVSLLGYSRNFLSNNFGSDAGVLIYPKDRSRTYAKILQTSLEGINIKEFILRSENQKQIEGLILKMVLADANKVPFVVPIIVSSFIPFGSNEYDYYMMNNGCFSVTVKRSFKMDSDSRFEFEIMPNTKLEIEFCK